VLAALPALAHPGLFCLPGFLLQSNVSPLDLTLDNDISAISEVGDCRDLDHTTPEYSALALCYDGNEYNGITQPREDEPCPANAYPAMLVPDGSLNAYNEKVDAFKVCAWCPAGEERRGEWIRAGLTGQTGDHKPLASSRNARVLCARASRLGAVCRASSQPVLSPSLQSCSGVLTLLFAVCFRHGR
jgi:hypothetical protein